MNLAASLDSSNLNDGALGLMLLGHLGSRQFLQFCPRQRAARFHSNVEFQMRYVESSGLPRLVVLDRICQPFFSLSHVVKYGFRFQIEMFGLSNFGLL